MLYKKDTILDMIYIEFVMNIRAHAYQILWYSKNILLLVIQYESIMN